MMSRTWPKKILLVLGGLLLSLVLAEAGLRVTGAVLSARQRHRHRFAGGGDPACTILCVGESTTAESWEGESYPRHLEQILNGQGRDQRFRVVNLGAPGHDSDYIVSALPDALADYEPDIVVAMMGINDGWSWQTGREVSRATWFHDLRVVKLAAWIRQSLCAPSGPPKNKPEHHLQSTPGKDAESTQYVLVDIPPPEKGKRTKADDSPYERSKIALEASQPDDAIDLLWEAIRREPDHLKAPGRLAEIYYQTHSPDAAIENLALGIEKAPVTGIARNRLVRALALLNCAAGEAGRADAYWNSVKDQPCNPQTRRNYERMQRMVEEEGAVLVAVQYPMREMDSLHRLLPAADQVATVDNSESFRAAVAKDGIAEYFTDLFAGDFGHCTVKGNRLLAKNVAKTILTAVLPNEDE